MGRGGHDTTGQDRTGQGRTGQDRAGLSINMARLYNYSQILFYMISV